MGWKIVEEVFEHQHPALKPSDHAVLLAIAYHAAHDSRKAWPSNQTLSSESGGYSTRQVTRSIARLVKHGYLSGAWDDGYHRDLWVRPACDWEGAIKRKRRSVRSNPVDPESGGTAALSMGVATRASGDDTVAKEPVTNPSPDHPRNQQGTGASPSGPHEHDEATDARLSGRTGNRSPADMFAAFKSKANAAAALTGVTLKDFEPDGYRSRLVALMKKHDVSQEDMLTLMDNYVAGHRLHWANGDQHHPIQLFCHGPKFEELLRALRKKQARQSVVQDESDGGGWVPLRVRGGT